MKNKGFTLIELLATIVLLGLIFTIVTPKVLEVIEKKEIEIDDATLKLIYNGTEQYMNNNIDTYPKTIGRSYCFLLEDLDKENLIPISIDDYLDKYVKVKIGKTNSYKIVDTCDICTKAECFSYINESHNISETSVQNALDDLYNKLK